MKNALRVLLNLLVFGFAFGCEEKTVCDGEMAFQVQTFLTEEFEACGLQNLDHRQKEVNLIIKTQAEFEKYVSCQPQSDPIDFNEFFLLAGRYKHQQCVRFDRQEVTICENRIFYTVNLMEQDCYSISDVFYFALIDRKFEDLEVKFNVKFKN
jgi:hypothetical protein